MRVLDLFAGIGGFSLAAHWMGWETVAFVEKDEFCQRVLRKNFPGVPIYDDIRDYNGSEHAADIVCGGFPCQPYSHAGKRKGTADNRHLWPEMLRTVIESQARFVVGENVYGLINWSKGLVFEQVQADLEAAGYEIWPGVVPACGVGAPHRRNRIWFVANLIDNGDLRSAGQDASASGKEWLSERNALQRATQPASIRPDPDTFGELGPEARLPIKEVHSIEKRNDAFRSFRGHDRFYDSPLICRRDDGIPNGMDRIRALGNSIVPQIAFEIFRAIEAADMKPEPRADGSQRTQL